MAKKQKGSAEAVEQAMNQAAEQRYRSRLGHLKQGKAAFKKKDYVKAMRQYNTYLQILAEHKNVDEKSLLPKHFDDDKELPELLLISHAYWDMAQVYDQSPSLEKEFRHCLERFVKFTAGQKFQTPNVGMIKRLLKKRAVKNRKDFEQALVELQGHSKKCYVASSCFGPDHPRTESLRRWRPALRGLPGGPHFIRAYYRYAPQLLAWKKQSPRAFAALEGLFIRPFLTLVTSLLRKIYGPSSKTHR